MKIEGDKLNLDALCRMHYCFFEVTDVKILMRERIKRERSLLTCSVNGEKTIIILFEMQNKHIPEECQGSAKTQTTQVAPSEVNG